MKKTKKMKAWQTNVKYVSIGMLLLGAFSLSGCAVLEDTSVSENKITTSANAVAKELPTDQLSIVDNDALYEKDVDDSVVTMYLTVRQGNKEENTNHTWAEVNQHSTAYYEELGIDRYQTEAILQVGDENGPLQGELGYGLVVPNAIVNVRGQTTSNAEMKSYKIELKNDKESFREQQTINLNKHVFDSVRFRNKLSYDLLEELPGLISMRTQFVHLYVKDETVPGNPVFVDYGLYTQVEQPNKTYLENHGFNRYGQFYKANMFEFYQYEDVIKLKSDATYQEDAFNKLLEIKGDNDHSKMIAMLADVNNYEIPIETTVDRWFDEDNLASWMAFHILTGNVDTQSRNFYLYSPLNLEKWYFISWDNDDSFTRTEARLMGEDFTGNWQKGVSNYWGNILFKRVLKSEHYRELLDEKIETYRAILTEEKLSDMIADYNSVTWKYRNQMPDLQYMKVTNEEYLQICAGIPKEIEENYQLYKESLKEPTPFYIWEMEPSVQGFKCNWEASYDFGTESISYSFELAKDYSFSEPIVKQTGLTVPECEFASLEPGQYFVRVIASNESGLQQTAFDYYTTDTATIYGVKCFYVLEDGTIVGEAQYEQQQ